MSKEKSLRNRPPVRVFKVLLTVVSLIYAFFFILSLYTFTQIWGPPFHPEIPRFLIMNLSMFMNSVLTGLLYVVIIYQLIRLLGLIINGEPFNQESPKRIRRIAYCTFGMAAINAVAELTRHITMSSSISSKEFWIVIVSFILRAAQTVLLGLGILIIAFVLEVGVRLQQDQSLTI